MMWRPVLFCYCCQPWSSALLHLPACEYLGRLCCNVPELKEQTSDCDFVYPMPYSLLPMTEYLIFATCSCLGVLWIMTVAKSKAMRQGLNQSRGLVMPPEQFHSLTLPHFSPFSLLLLALQSWPLCWAGSGLPLILLQANVNLLNY